MEEVDLAATDDLTSCFRVEVEALGGGAQLEHKHLLLDDAGS